MITDRTKTSVAVKQQITRASLCICRVWVVAVCTLIFCLSSRLLFAQTSTNVAVPKEIVLRDTIKTGLYKNGKFVGVVEFQKGQSLTVLKFENNAFVIEADGGEARISFENTELGRTNYALLKQLKAVPLQAATQVNAVTNQVDVRDTPEWYYRHAKSSLTNNEANYSQYIGEDIIAAKTLIQAAEKVVTAFESGDKELTQKIGAEYWQIREAALKSGTINAYKYNEIVKTEVVVPVSFDLYSGGENFYFKVGDGAFSTISTVPVENLRIFLESLSKLNSWIETCRSQKLETKKELCRVGETTFTFVSFDEGRMWFVWMAIAGDFRKDALLESQEVKLTPLNFWRLAARVGQAKEIVSKRIKEEQDAKKLK
jgi:hypothetical protein